MFRPMSHADVSLDQALKPKLFMTDVLSARKSEIKPEHIMKEPNHTAPFSGPLTKHSVGVLSSAVMSLWDVRPNHLMQHR